LNRHPRKRFGQKCFPERFLCDFCAVRELGKWAADDLGDVSFALMDN
jgi:hypothetical protein